ncbi:MAG: 50S ribosomal protein L13 [Epulopiscium sp.]|nr:50S ribosomal protein L13 [Candidatus Epulonipiscium sp.]
MKTYMANAQTVERKWYIIDATNMTLGRLASEVAIILRGKHKPIYTPHVDTGDHVIIINAEKVKLTGKKLDQKHYHYHTGYPGGLRSIQYRDFLAKSPEKAVMKAVKGMLPKNSLGRDMLTKLRVYRGSEHPHAAQQPEVLELKF